MYQQNGQIDSVIYFVQSTRHFVQSTKLFDQHVFPIIDLTYKIKPVSKEMCQIKFHFV